MSQAQPATDPAFLTLEFDTPELFESDLAGLLSDLKSVVAGLRTPNVPKAVQVRWKVQSVSKSSPLRISLLPIAYLRNRLVDAPGVEDLPGVAVAGINDLIGGVRPSAFNDQALGHLRGLFDRAAKGNGVARLASNDARVDLTDGVAATIGRILDPSYHAFGTVEGKLDLINMHGPRPVFAVYDDLTGRRIDCSFGENVSLQHAASAITQRVAVEGEISYRSDGNIVRISADRLIPFPPDATLPSADDVFGIFSA